VVTVFILGAYFLLELMPRLAQVYLASALYLLYATPLRLRLLHAEISLSRSYPQDNALEVRNDPYFVTFNE